MKPPRLFAAAFSAWLLVMPAAVLLAAAALRQLQPRQFEPARTSWLIFEWTTTHISRSEAALLFICSPSVAVIAGCVALLRVWHGNETLRQDVNAAIAGLRRHLAIALLGTGTLLAGVILAGVLAHIVTD